LAEYFTAHPLKHPILFLSFSAEERGLLGSKAFVKDKVINPKKMLAMINLDMIGRMRDDYLFVGGMGTAKEFHEILDPVFAKSSLNLDLSDKGEAPSDNTSFYHGGVPALFFFTDIHDDYHMPGDDADGILYDEEVQILNIVKDCAIALDQVKKLKFTSNDGMGMPPDFMERNMMHFQHAMERKQKLGKLGVTPEEGKEVIKAKKVREDSAADQAGLKAGDKLLSIEGRAMVTILDMRRALGGKMKGETVEVVYSRSGKSHTATITLQ
jgi:aminopeptidase YwaD